MEKEINYQEYDAILTKMMERMFLVINKQDRIIVKYKKNKIEDKLVLRLCFLWKDIIHKPVYIRTGFFTYLKLKFFSGTIHKMKYNFKKTTGVIYPYFIMTQVGETPEKLEEIYNAYYKIEEK